MLTLLRNKNKAKKLIDYDLNIFMEEREDHHGNWYYDPTSWSIHVYKVDGNGHHEVDDPLRLTVDEIRSIGINNDEYFEAGDAWYGMYGYLQDYWNVLPDTIKQYLESFPKYENS